MAETDWAAAWPLPPEATTGNGVFVAPAFAALRNGVAGLRGAVGSTNVHRIVADAVKVYPPRPATPVGVYVDWVGDAEPIDALLNDTWVELSTGTMRLRTSKSNWTPVYRSPSGSDVQNIEGNLYGLTVYDAGADLTQFTTESTSLELSLSDDWGSAGPASLRTSVTSSTNVKVDSATRPASMVPVTAGVTYTASVDVNNATVTVPFVLQIKWRDTNGSAVGSPSFVNSSPTTIPYATVQTLTLSATAPTGATNAYFILRWGSATPVGGDYFLTDRWSFIATSTGTNPPPTTPVVSTDIGAPAPTAAVTGGARNAMLWPFASSSIWNLGIATSATYSDGTDAATTQFQNPDGGVWINQGQYSHPIYYARTSDAYTAWSDSNVSGRSGAFKAAPGEIKATGTDRHMHTMNPYGRWLDEMIGVSSSDSANPGLGGSCTRHQRVDLYGSGIGPQNGVRAYGGSAIGGLIRAWEVDPSHPSYDGELHHPLAFALSAVNQLYSTGSAGYDSNGNGTSKGYVWPATEQDYAAASIYKGAIPMGALFAIPASIDVTTLGLSSPWALMMARACQKYGAYNTDTSTLLTFYVEVSAPGSFRSALLANGAADLAKIVKAMVRVTNSTVDTPGGGTPDATRLAPTAPPLQTQATVTPRAKVGSISYIGTSSQSTTYQQNLSLSLPAGSTTGDTLVVTATAGNSKTVATPTGWTQVGAATAGSRRTYVFSKTLAAGETSFAFANSAANNSWACRLTVWRGVNASSPVAGVATRVSSSALRSWAFGPVDGVVTGEVLLTCVGFDKSVTVAWDEDLNSVTNTGSLLCAYKYSDGGRNAVNLNITDGPAPAGGLLVRLSPA